MRLLQGAPRVVCTSTRPYALVQVRVERVSVEVGVLEAMLLVGLATS